MNVNGQNYGALVLAISGREDVIGSSFFPSALADISATATASSSNHSSCSSSSSKKAEESEHAGSTGDRLGERHGVSMCGGYSVALDARLRVGKNTDRDVELYRYPLLADGGKSSSGTGVGDRASRAGVEPVVAGRRGAKPVEAMSIEELLQSCRELISSAQQRYDSGESQPRPDPAEPPRRPSRSTDPVHATAATAAAASAAVAPVSGSGWFLSGDDGDKQSTDSSPPSSRQVQLDLLHMVD
jgi:hypothetical protein